MDPDEARRLRVHRLVADKVTDEMLTKPAGELTLGETEILKAALRGSYAEEIMRRIDELNKRRNTA